jgi:5-methylcytosine-specific restriction endonuclease McrA
MRTQKTTNKRKSWSRRVRQRGGRRKWSSQVIKGTWRRSGARCHLCDRAHLLMDYGWLWSIDHSVSRARGGTDRPTNLRVACCSCNSGKRDRTNNVARPRAQARAKEQKRIMLSFLRSK